MTPQEQALVADLFDRLAKLEKAPRDPDAEHVISEGLSRAPGAIYPLVQTVLVQDEALKRAEARIRELEGGAPSAPQGGFLDTMRSTLFGGGNAPRGSVPSVRPTGAEPDPRWGPGAAPTQVPPPAPMGVPFGQGGSFLGTAAAAAAGVIGGSLLLDGIRGMFGHHGNAFAAYDPSSPWGNAASAAGSDLAREAGLEDVGGRFGPADDQRVGLLDADDAEGLADDLDFGGFDGGDSA